MLPLFRAVEKFCSTNRLINNEDIPPVENGKSFSCLRRHSDLEMSNQKHQLDIKEALTGFLQRIDKLTIILRISS